MVVNSKVAEFYYSTSKYPSYNGWLYDAKFTTLTIGDNITKIGSCAFAVCKSLTSITISNSVTEIGSNAFNTCDSLTDITIPDSVTEIRDGAFCGCKSLTSVTIAGSVTKIGDSAFYTCHSLTSVYCKSATPPAGGYAMFNGNASDRKIYVPRNSVEAYKSASNWSDYASSIEGYDF